jgi:hypothetical protein
MTQLYCMVFLAEHDIVTEMSTLLKLLSAHENILRILTLSLITLASVESGSESFSNYI